MQHKLSGLDVNRYMQIERHKCSFANRQSRAWALVLLSCCGRFGILIAFLLQSPIVLTIVVLIIYRSTKVLLFSMSLHWEMFFMQEINTFPSFKTLSSPLHFVYKPKCILKRCLSPYSSSLKIMGCGRPPTLVWFLCQHHFIQCTSRKYVAVSCWEFFQHGRFSVCAEGTWPVPIVLPLLPPPREQDVAEGPACPSHSLGVLQHAGAVGKQESRLLSRPSGFNRPFKQSLLPDLKIRWVFWSWMPSL